MALISLGAAFSAPKRRPKAYKAKDAAYMTGGNRGYYVASLPRPYPKNEPQRKIKDLAATCKIKKGIKKADLQNIMKDCITKENYAKAKA